MLDWNADAIGFYESLGAVPMDEWTTFRVAGAPLAALGARRGSVAGGRLAGWGGTGNTPGGEARARPASEASMLQSGFTPSPRRRS